MANLAISQEHSDDALRVAATIWARATARRDRLSDVPAAADKLPGLLSALEATGASLHLAREGAQHVGFALLVPAGDSLELRYLGVDPAVWGRGIGGHVLDYVADQARTARFDAVTLWVLEDNLRAIAIYERSGWQKTPGVKSQIASRRTECHLQFPLR